MLYIPKGQHGHPTWIGLIELVEVVQAASECNEGEAHAQIKAALADSAIWPLDWEPVPVPSAYCESRLGPSAPIFGKPVRPPPPSSKSLDDFTDRRSVSHWRAIKIDWEQGRVLDDFEREAYPRLNEQA